MTDRHEFLVDHYQKTNELTTLLWQQRNRLFLTLLVTIGASSLLTYTGDEGESLLALILAAALDVSVDQVPKDFPFDLVAGLLTVTVFYLMFNLYHRTVSVYRQYAYLGRLEQEIRRRLDFDKDESSVAFTRESSFYWNGRPALLKTVKWVYFGLLGALLVVYFAGRIGQSYRAATWWFLWGEIAVGLATMVYFVGYATASVELDSGDEVLGSRPRSGDHGTAGQTDTGTSDD